MQKRTMTVIALCVTVLCGTARATAPDGLPHLPRATQMAWDAYVARVEARHATDVTRLLKTKATDDGLQDHAERQALLSGNVIVGEVDVAQRGPAGVPGARLHHWRGRILLRGTTVEQVMARLEQGPPPQRDVLRAIVLTRDRAAMRVFLRVRHQQILTVTYDTEHDVRFARDRSGRARSTTRATRITEVSAPGTSDERALSEDEDHDFLWRLHAYWTYTQVPGGVVVECESVSLSRDVPFALGPIARPLIARAAAQSMRAALLALRAPG